MSALFVHGGRLASGEVVGLTAPDGRITGVAPSLPAPAGAEPIDATGLLLPGAIDPHVHFNAIAPSCPVWPPPT